MDAYTLCNALSKTLGSHPQVIRVGDTRQQVRSIEAIDAHTYRILTPLGWYTFDIDQSPFITRKEK